MSLINVCEVVKSPVNTGSPWATVAIPESAVFSLEDVMSEQLARELQEKENSSCSKEDQFALKHLDLVDAERPTNASGNKQEEDIVDSDYLVAQLLQLELDKEYDEALKHKENFRNKNSRGNKPTLICFWTKIKEPKI